MAAVGVRLDGRELFYLAARDVTEKKRSLLALQAKATYEIDEIDGPAWWTALGRTPQAAFLVSLDVTAPLPTREVPIVQHPLEALTFDRTTRTRPDAPAPA